jgi:NADP-reducing hydrogenase subunit HndB
MPRITSLDDLNRLKVNLVMKRNQDAYRGGVLVTVGMGTCGIAVGALEVFQALESAIRAHELQHVVVGQTGCIGQCGHEPIVEVTVGDAPKVSYGGVTREIAGRIVKEHILDGRVVDEYVIDTTPFPTL